MHSSFQWIDRKATKKNAFYVSHSLPLYALVYFLVYEL